MDARTVALVSAGDPGRRSRGICITFPAGEDSGVGEIAFGAPRKHRLPLVGATAPFPVDEKMANSGGGLRRGVILGWGKNRYSVLMVTALAAGLPLWVVTRSTNPSCVERMGETLLIYKALQMKDKVNRRTTMFATPEH